MNGRLKLVFVTQAIDADDPDLAATIDMVAALARRSSEVVVICDRSGRHDLPGNVAIRTFGAGTRFARGVRYLRALAGVLATGRPDAILAHMCPIYVVLAAPVAKPLRIPLLLWYTHWSFDWTLRAATPLCSAALSVARESFPLRSSKVRAIGHGIDLSRFAPGREEPDQDNGSIKLLALGRTEPWKGLELLLAGFEGALESGLDATLEIRGPSVKPGERRHRAQLEDIISRSATLRARARLEPPLPRDRLPELIPRFDALVSAARVEPGRAALDKVVYEASGCAVPVIACNPELEHYLGGLPVQLYFKSGDSRELTQVLLDFAASDPRSRAEAGLELRRRAEASHSVEAWADGVLRIAHELRSH